MALPRFFCLDHRVEFDESLIRRHSLCELTADLPSARRLQSLSSSSARANVKVRWHSTGMRSFNKVLGNGCARGGVVLVAAPPGLGKSTLCIQILLNIARAGGKALYISGEEKDAQVLARLRSVGGPHPNLYQFSTESWEAALVHIHRLKPHVIVVDSMQRLATIHGGAHGAAGSDQQVRAMAKALVYLAKHASWEPCIFVVGHVNAKGETGGPMSARHDVDTECILSLGPNGEVFATCPIKNRFGPRGELAGFRFEDAKLVEIPDLSTALLEGALGDAGAVAMPAAFRTRVVLAPAEAVVSPLREGESGGGSWRAKAGMTDDALRDLCDLMQQRGGVQLARRDVRVQLPSIGDAPLSDHAAEAAMACAILSASESRPPMEGLYVFGQFTLTGKLRPADRLWERLVACHERGGRLVLGPAMVPAPKTPGGIEYRGVTDMGQLFEEFRRSSPTSAGERSAAPVSPASA